MRLYLLENAGILTTINFAIGAIILRLTQVSYFVVEVVTHSTVKSPKNLA